MCRRTGLAGKEARNSRICSSVITGNLLGVWVTETRRAPTRGVRCSKGSAFRWGDRDKDGGPGGQHYRRSGRRGYDPGTDAVSHDLPKYAEHPPHLTRPTRLSDLRRTPRRRPLGAGAALRLSAGVARRNVTCWPRCACSRAATSQASVGTRGEDNTILRSARSQTLGTS